MQVKLVILRITDLCLIFISYEPLNGTAVKKIIFLSLFDLIT